MSVLLQDASILMRPHSVTEIPNGPDAEKSMHSHPSSSCLLVLSDIAALFARASKHTHVGHKLVFYAAHLMSTPSFVLSVLADELSERAKLMIAESNPPNTRAPATPASVSGKGTVPKIEEL
jgi:hypothetical protein